MESKESEYKSNNDFKDFKDFKDNKDYKGNDDDIDIDEYNERNDKPPKIEITKIKIKPNEIVDISAPLDLNISFELDRDVVAAYWIIRFLVDSSENRIIKILGETPVEDYPDGDSDMNFHIDKIDVSGIPPSTLTNSGLLMAIFCVDGEEVATVNMVVNVFKRDGQIVREILSPME